jgi:hypothetical protein
MCCEAIFIRLNISRIGNAIELLRSVPASHVLPRSEVCGDSFRSLKGNKVQVQCDNNHRIWW